MYFSVSSFAWMVAIPEIISPQPWKVKDWKFWLRTSAGLLFWNCFNCNVCSTTKDVSPIPISHINLSFLRSVCKLFIRVTSSLVVGLAQAYKVTYSRQLEFLVLPKSWVLKTKCLWLYRDSPLSFFARHFEQKKLEFNIIKMFRLLWCLAKTAF